MTNFREHFYDSLHLNDEERRQRSVAEIKSLGGALVGFAGGVGTIVGLATNNVGTFGISISLWVGGLGYAAHQGDKMSQIDYGARERTQEKQLTLEFSPEN